MQKIRSFLFFLFLFEISLFAEEEMVIPLQTGIRLVPIALFPFYGKDSGFSETYVRSLEGVLRFDLENSGRISLFHPPHAQPFDQETPPLQGRDLFYLVKVRVQKKKLDLRVVSLLSQTENRVEGIPLTGDLSQDRRKIHLLFDEMHREIFGVSGVAATRFLYTVRTQIAGKWTSDVWEADYDGYNARQVTQNGNYAITPLYLPSENGKPTEFFYVDYITGQPKIYFSSLDGRSKRFCSLKGNQLMPTVSKQRDQVALISDITGNPDLYLYRFSPQEGPIGMPQQVYSSTWATQGSPTFSPNGKQIAFVSNRDGSPRVYVMDIPPPGAKKKDLKLNLLTKFCRESTAPTWSPDGSKIAYCARTKGTRQIWVFDFEKNQEVQLTTGSLNKENPTWAADSLHLIYNTTDAGAAELYLINLNQTKPIKISSGLGEKHYPSWFN